MSTRSVELVGLAILSVGPVLAQPAPPRAIVQADTAHGVVIPDEYRWMETAGVALDPWIDAGDTYTQATLAALPGRSAHVSPRCGRWARGMWMRT